MQCVRTLTEVTGVNVLKAMFTGRSVGSVWTSTNVPMATLIKPATLFKADGAQTQTEVSIASVQKA